MTAGMLGWYRHGCCPGDTTAEVISGLIADEIRAIGCCQHQDHRRPRPSRPSGTNGRRTWSNSAACRRPRSDHAQSRPAPPKFIGRGGRIPAPRSRSLHESDFCSPDQNCLIRAARHTEFALPRYFLQSAKIVLAFLPRGGVITVPRVSGEPLSTTIGKTEIPMFFRSRVKFPYPAVKARERGVDFRHDHASGGNSQGRQFKVWITKEECIGKRFFRCTLLF